MDILPVTITADQGREAVLGDGYATADECRTMMSCFPTGVAVVTSVDHDRHPHGMTCTSLTSVTLAPPTIMVCVNVSNGTLDAIEASGGFAVNLLHTGGQRVAELFASAEPARFAMVRWRSSARLGMPWLARDSFAMAECEVQAEVPVSDHVAVFGTVRSVQCWPGVPLLYGLRKFSYWPADS